MSKYERYEEDNEYKDGLDRKPKIILIIGFILLLAVVLIIIVSCASKTSKKDTNNYLSSIRISGGELTPEFNKDNTTYNVNATLDRISVYCSAESIKAVTSGCNKSFDVAGTNMSHVITVKSESGSTKTYTLVIGKGESNSINVSINSDTESGILSNEDVLLKAVVLPNDDNLVYTWYKDGNIIENATGKTYLATESGKYTVKVLNLDGTLNGEAEEFEVKIEKNTKTSETNNKSNNSNTKTNQNTSVLKINSITGNSETWVSSVMLKVNATSSNGLAASAYSFDGGKTYQKGNSKNFTKNQTVTVVVKDKTGKTASKKIVISKIDTTKPSVSISASKKTNSSVVLTATINPSTTQSGYKYQWYKNNTAISGATSKTYTATASGTYKLRVTTGANVITYSSNYTFTITKFSCPTITVTTTNGYIVKPETWYGEVVYMKIVPTSSVVTYDIYLNQDGIYDSVSSKYSYLDTFNGTGTIKITNGGQRQVKFIMKDNKGNVETCYSSVYYLR